MIANNYTYLQYRRAKLTNSLEQRFEHLVEYLQFMFGMPTAILGLHNTFKNVLSGQERNISQITPRLVLTYSGISIDRGAMSGIQSRTSFISADDKGNVDEHKQKFRRLPVTCSFRCQMVHDNPLECIRLSEYLCLLALEVPQAAGDEFTISTIILDENSSIDNHFEENNNYTIDFGLNINCQIPEPLELPEESDGEVLAGVGVQLPDGTWDETSIGEIIYEKDENGNVVQGPVYEIDPVTGNYKLDDEGNRIPVIDTTTGEQVIGPVPLTDDDGNILYGNFVRDGWYRLYHRYYIHHHRFEVLCDSDGNLKGYKDPAGFLEYGDNSEHSFNCPEFWHRPAGTLYWPNRIPGEYIANPNELMTRPIAWEPPAGKYGAKLKLDVTDITLSANGGETVTVNVNSNTTWRLF